MAGVGSSGGSNTGSNGGATGWLVSPAAMASRLARTYTMQIPTASAFTHVADMPTTRAELVLYNDDTELSYVVDQVWWMSLTSITAASGATLIYQTKQISAPTDNTNILVSSPYGKPYPGSALKALAQTTFVANMWAAIAGGASGPAASIGFSCLAEVSGRIIVKPGFGLGLNVVVGTATGTGLIGMSWSEERLPRYS